MRILLHADIDLSLPGGLETHVRELAGALEARGHEVEIFARPENLPPFRIVRALDPARYDLVHLHGLDTPPTLAGHRALVRTLHFCTAAKMSVYVRLGRLQTLANLGNWRAVRRERGIACGAGPWIAVSNRVRDDFERWYHLDVTRATVISNGASFAAPRRDRAAVREAAGIAADARVLVTIGRSDFVKGYDLLARALRAPAVSGLTWVTVGGERPSRAPGRVVTGPVERHEVVDWIHAADVGALPSYYEGCSVALLEMLAGGLYTLAHDVGNAVEVIRPGSNGAIVERSADAWRAALSAAALRPPARARPGLDSAYSWSEIAERTLEFYGTARAGR